ncbi:MULTISPECIES: Stk1 family PASTA domain-containing Ser/Thr kinase [Gordonia]|uniref:non-specific serine/threonine protein kinase n=1 Tax=Gordonia amicalis TaxID=89053 RepID=A0AAE4U9Z9_9ACTN|nr:MULTISPECIES: Stk1 family PASTA domain-containing Ser/Thr kinase [Gordonia]ATD68950.1 serine/threonine protein kinase [Gordonia sp. 1D]MBA5846552.1 Stk1 family PASTA domain-containing Ser/Thr kinase [Gordonia amicalis]MCZ4580895.1 Stk1 family PASTA domain-containing Ser/Thr kinase [Gordonia amicalis]MCZ4651072.1 Stk1 family PASTA domain-containing Ser/Thr kinase [Gordonia amicalis]MDJ0454314.1 Stk1 family PASTA domain-containing Ser/Thr kinase [Gordonia amicalis]
MTTPHHLSDRYELGETLGFGGMSEVHYARDLVLHRDVAIKVLRADLARDPSFYLRFRREAQNAAKLNHPTIVQVFDTGEAETEDGPLPFIVMEYVDGDTLRDVLRANGPIAPRQAMTWMADVAAAMDFSHRNGIVHRDMKPANVMIDKSGAVKVMDFGIARAMSDSTSTMTQTSAVMGTAQYLSPEQARGIKVDPRSDIYSMGCVLFELLTGEPPFTGDSPVAVAHQHVHEDPPWPSHVRPDIPRELDSVVLKAMSKNKENRYQSAADLRADLIRVLAGGKPSAPMLLTDEERTEFIDTGPRRPTRSETTGPRRAVPARAGGNHRRDDAYRDDADDEPPRRRSRRLMAGAMAAVVLLVGTLFLWSPWSSGSDPEVTVPAVSGLSSDDARSSLERAGFEVRVLEEPSLDVGPGLATRSTPGEGVLAAEGSEVALYISTGPQRHRIPSDLVGKTPSEAQDALKVLGFTNVRTERVDSPIDMKDKVVSTAPKIGTEVPVNGAVVLNVGNGPKEITVRDVVGMPADRARAVLEELGMTVEVIAVDSEQPAGEVISTSPGPGSTAEQGSTVQLSVSRGNLFTVPNLRGKTPVEAQASLEQAGWERSTLTRQTRNVPLNSPDSGRVIGQDPPAGSKARKSGAITIVVGQASLLPN